MGVLRYVCIAVIGCLGLGLIATGCGSGTAVGTVPATALTAGLPWPPDAVRLASETDFNYNGIDWLAKSDTATDSGNSLLLTGGGDLAWAYYGVSDLSTTNELLSVSVTYAQTPSAPGDGTQLYIGLANYDLDSWEWFVPSASPWEHDITSPADYRGPAGNGYLAVALAGPGTASVATVSFTSAGDFVGIPQNLTAETIAVELVELNWDAVASATGYNVYRSTKPDMSSAMKVNEEPVTENTFEDEFMGFGQFLRNRYLYYQVTAVGATESEPSNIAKTWSFGIDMPAPQNFRILQKAATAIRVAWDWEGANPSSGFRVFVDIEPDFHIDTETESGDPSPSSRTYDKLGCESNVTYYFKMCARSGDNLGRLTPEISDVPTNYWNWSDVTTIDTGEAPLRAAKIDAGEIAVAYFDEGDVNLAVRSGTGWSVDQPLIASGSLLYNTYVDLAYSNGTYVVASWDSAASDAWAAHGSPGAWTRNRIHGDGNTGLFHPESGHYIVCAADEDELAVVHYFNRASPDSPLLILHTKPASGGSWSQTTIRALTASQVYTFSHCISFLDNDLYYIGNNGLEAELWFTSRDGGWDFSTTDIRAGDYRFRKYHDLERFNGTWYTPAMDSIQSRLYLLSDDGSVPWTAEALTDDSMGYEARFDVEGSEAVIIYKGGGYINFALFSNDWSAEPIIIPGVSDFSNSVDILLIGGEPFFIFGDDDTGQIKIARGVPPEE